ncbi:membrane-bound transcription factor site-2 protease [Trichonephila inaurata madagascariensis]|uniref:Membrane-bound transcription factor site-2 protease n=1 Tax=Trichonephila inaurata madagascariensis TaxID=2747483 RepID=A0A8X7CMW6_9ARAC|nr:membrane-bound transcription factor site-2 protease [Trichonephila inaurata madagascariensis]
MGELLFIVSLAVVFGTIYFLDLIFRTCMFFPYIKFLHDTGISIRPLTISWESTHFNRQFLTLGRFKPVLLRRWFQTGAIIVSIYMIPVLILLLVPIYQYLYVDNSNPVLVPIIPGLNLPYSQLFYYAISIFICVTVHEFGHALAASREKVTIEGFGFALFGFLPMAYVRLPSEQLKQLSLPQQLRIYSAGVWHNVVLACFALLLMYSNPILLKPLYQQGNGVTVVNVKEGTGPAQKGGLMLGDTIISINDCLVETVEDWNNCLQKEMTDVLSGFCVSKDYIRQENSALENYENCCSNTTGYLCFRHSDAKNKQLMCLPGRKVAENSIICTENRDCRDDLCLIPILLSKSERFLKIQRFLKSPVLYLGPIQEVFASVAVSPWTSESTSVQYIDMYEIFLGYIFAFSSGLAIMNVIPFFYLDGQFLTECVVHNYLSSCIPKVSQRSSVIFSLKMIGSLIGFLSMCVTLLKMFV